MISSLKKAIRANGNAQKKATVERFFKTGKGSYSEGDVFVGGSAAELRAIAKQFQDVSLSALSQLLQSKIHEDRVVALLILVSQYKKNDNKKEIVDFYLAHTGRINNWDLVDISAYYILGPYLLDKPRKILYTLAKSTSLWERRIAIIATYAFIKENDLEDTFALSERLFDDTEDLMHKAVGWMLREAGKRDQPALERFLKKHIRRIPRTALRYAIEKFPEQKRKAYLLK